eukprot:2238384-Amphidinium_carterae.1
MCDAFSNSGVARQNLALAFAEKHAFVYQPMANSQRGGGAIPDQGGRLGSRELEEDVIHHIGESLGHEVLPAQE